MTPALLLVALLSAPAARASSAAHPLQDVPQLAGRAVDGKRATAWCEGAPGAGVGEWIEVRPRCAPRKGVCRLELLNGWAKDEASFRRRGRVARIRVSACGGATEGEPFDLADSPEPQELTLRTPLDGPACVRVTILQATPGHDPDTCLAEVRAFCECAP